MKIALLNLTVDSNFGGNLQRFALMKVLVGLGHDVTFLNIRTKYKLKWYKCPYSYSKRIINKYLLNKKTHIRIEKYKTIEMERLCREQNDFFEKYINHTKPLFTIRDLIQESKNGYEIFVVGSDQVWRKRMTRQIGLKNYFFHFLKKTSSVKIAYAVSLGVDYNQYSKSEIKELGDLYKLFNAVSVRETSALKLLNSYGWQHPKPRVTLDPTLLLDKKDYISLIESHTVQNDTKDKIFCYVLDYNQDFENTMKLKSMELGAEVVKYDLSGGTGKSIVQWLADIYNARLVITDSYHGTIFSILFNKPFVLLKNEDRGGGRFDSLAELLNFSFENSLSLDYVAINRRIERLRDESIAFLNKAL